MNVLHGTLQHCASADGIHLLTVSLGPLHCTAMAVGDTAPATPGDTVALHFRELDVALSCGDTGALSIRNCLPCTVQSVSHGQLLSRVGLVLATHTVHAVITRASAQRLALAPGMAVSALIKSHAMSVSAPACCPS